MIPRIETEREINRCWIADVIDLPGVIVYGETREEAIRKAKELAEEVLRDREPLTPGSREDSP